jgi:hypothetical protein
MKRETAISASIVVAGCIIVVAIFTTLLWYPGDPTVFRTVTVADKVPSVSGLGGGTDILCTDNNLYLIGDFSSLVQKDNAAREARGQMALYGQFYWNSHFKIGETYTCNFNTAPSGNYVLSNCTQVG